MIMEKDMINHPDHYKSGKFEVIEIIDEFKLNFQTGNALKYICRAGKKDTSKTMEDLEKARFYIDWEIKRLKRDKDKIAKQELKEFWESRY